MFNIKNILLTTDFSRHSLTAASYAIELAQQYDAKIHLLYVLEKTPPILTIRTLDLSQEKIIKSIEDDAKKSIEETIQKIKKEEGDKVKIEGIIKKGIDYQEITKYADDNDIDVIVIATHGNTGILHTLIGSVAEKVIRYTQKPVLVITPSKDKES